MPINPCTSPSTLFDGIAAVASESMLLYRGLKNRYRPELVDDSWNAGTDFTDCPGAALLYAQTSRGVLIVVDIDYDDNAVPQRVREASWPEREAKRFIIRRRFDDDIVAVFLAKELRTRLRREGYRNASFTTKARVLRVVLDDELRRHSLRRRLGLGSEFVDRVSSHEQGWVNSGER
jgi:hypothetical protein